MLSFELDRSFMSELSDIKEMGSDDEGLYQDFHAGLREIYDVVNPGLGTSEDLHSTPFSLLRASSMNQ